MPEIKLKYQLILLLCMFYNIQNYAQNGTCDALLKESRVAMDNQNFVKALEILSKAKISAEKEKNYEGVYCALNTMAECYYYMLDYGEALRIALETYDLAREELDIKRENKALINIGALYIEDKNYKKGEEYLTKAYNSLKRQGDYQAMGTAATNLGDAAVLQGDYEKAISYYNEVLQITEKTSKAAVNANIGIIQCELHFGNIKLARQKAEALYRNKDLQKSYNKDLQLLYIIAESYLKEDDYDMAIEGVAKILKNKPDIYFKNKSFELLVGILVQKGDFRTALTYKDSVNATERRLSEINNGRLFEANKAKFELANYKSELMLRDERIASERKIFFSLVAVLVAGIAIVVLVLRQKKSIAERNHKIAELELEKRENQNLLLEKQMQEKEIQAQLEQEKLRSEIEARNRKLSAKALYLSGRNELIEQVIDSLTSIPGMSGSKEVSDYVRSLKGYLKTDAEWDDFISYFEQVNPNFLKVLQEKHPALSFADIRFICYIYMNLDLKEISTILNITTEACKKRKQRIAKKMDIEADDLHAYIFSINS